MLHYPKVILFDLDDTLLSFEGVAEQTWEKYCIDFIKNGLSYDIEDFLARIHTTRKWYWSDQDRHKRKWYLYHPSSPKAYY